MIGFDKNNLFFLIAQFKKLCALPVYVVSCMVPKKPGLILFGAWFGKSYSDNPRYIYEYAIGEGSDNVFWVAKNKELFDKVRALGRPVVYAYSLKGIWLQMRAKVIVFSHSHWSDFLPSCIGVSTLRVQAWHGAPLKKIGNDDNLSRKTPLRSVLSKLFFPYMAERFDLVFATGDPDRTIFSRAFNTALDSIKITGYPRNDILKHTQDPLCRRPKNILYMPTFRGAPGSEFELLGDRYFDFEYIERQLELHDAVLYIKLHPVQKLQEEFRRKVASSLRVIVLDNNEDVYPFLNSCDALLTDYSSIFFDFLLTGKPIYMLPIDIESYKKADREMYYPYEEICPSVPQINWIDMLHYIFYESYPVDRHKNLVHRFHVYNDCGSSRRAYDCIKDLLRLSNKANG